MTINVIRNQPPVITYIAPNPVNETTSTNTPLFTVSASDPDTRVSNVVYIYWSDSKVMSTVHLDLGLKMRYNIGWSSSYVISHF